MSHHGSNDSPIPEELRQLLGATNKHPEGKLAPKDEGGIQFAIGVKDGKVCLDFGNKPISWIGMNPSDALSLATKLINKAKIAARESGSILTLKV